MALLALPGLMALGAVVLAVFLFRLPKRQEPTLHVLTMIGAALLLIFAFGVGACYGMFLLFIY